MGGDGLLEVGRGLDCAPAHQPLKTPRLIHFSTPRFNKGVLVERAPPALPQNSRTPESGYTGSCQTPQAGMLILGCRLPAGGGGGGTCGRHPGEASVDHIDLQVVPAHKGSEIAVKGQGQAVKIQWKVNVM